MSGIKCSEIRLERERKACQEALNKISVLTAGIEGLKEKIRGVLREIPEGVKGSFSDDLQKVTDWLSKKPAMPSEDMDSTRLNNVVKGLGKMKEEGRRALDLLIEIKEVRRDAKAKELIGRLERSWAELKGMETLLNKWRPEAHENITNTFGGLSSMIEKGDFVVVEKELNRLDETLNRLGREVASLEGQDSQRRYVLDALRKVCVEMGWSEEGEPRLEDVGNPGSPLLYEVETYSAGKLNFRLTLDEIRLDSQISSEEDACYKEFDNLSERLKKFGVDTNFRPPNAPDKKPIDVMRKARGRGRRAREG